MREAKEMVGRASQFFSTTSYTNLQRRWDADYDMFTLKAYDAGPKYYSFTSNRPRLVVNKAISMITDAKLMVRCPDEAITPSDMRETANNIERFCYGALTIIDDKFSRIPDMPSLRQQMAWYSCMRGTIVLRVFVYKDAKGKTQVSIVSWDAYNTAYWLNDKGVSEAIYRREATKEEIKSQYGVTIDTPTATIYDCWDETDNGVICNDKYIKEPTPHGMDYCPVFILRTGATPIVARTGLTDTAKYAGESILAENRMIYPMINKTMSDVLTIVRRGVMVPIGVWSSGGQRTIDTDIWQVEDGSVVPMDSDRQETIKPLIEPTMPADTMPLISILQQEEESGGFSPLALGMIDLHSRLSGYAINNVQSATATKILPFINVIERAYKTALRAMLEQFKAKSWAPVEVWGRTSKNQPFGMPAPVRISPDDIESDWNLDINLVPVFPKDDAQRYELARLATQGDRPLLSVKTAQEDILNIDDTDLEKEFIAGEAVDMSPLLILLKGYRAAKADKDDLKASTILAQAQQLMAQMMPQGQPQQGQQLGNPMDAQPNTPGMMARMNPGAPTAGGKTGLSSSTMPPEAMGTMPAGAANAKGA